MTAQKREEEKKAKSAQSDAIFHKQWDIEKEERRVYERQKADERRIVEVWLARCRMTRL